MLNEYRMECRRQEAQEHTSTIHPKNSHVTLAGTMLAKFGLLSKAATKIGNSPPPRILRSGHNKISFSAQSRLLTTYFRLKREGVAVAACSAGEQVQVRTYLLVRRIPRCVPACWRSYCCCLLLCCWQPML